MCAQNEMSGRIVVFSICLARWGAFFEEGGGAFGLVGGGAERAEEFGFAAEGGFEGHVESFVDGAEGGGEDWRCLRELRVPTKGLVP